MTAHRLPLLSEYPVGDEKSGINPLSEEMN